MSIVVWCHQILLSTNHDTTSRRASRDVSVMDNASKRLQGEDLLPTRNRASKQSRQSKGRTRARGNTRRTKGMGHQLLTTAIGRVKTRHPSMNCSVTEQHTSVPDKFDEHPAALHGVVVPPAQQGRDVEFGLPHPHGGQFGAFLPRLHLHSDIHQRNEGAPACGRTMDPNAPVWEMTTNTLSAYRVWVMAVGTPRMS